MSNAIQPDIHIRKLYNYINREAFNGHFLHITVIFSDQADTLSFGRIFISDTVPYAELIVPGRYTDNYAGLAEQIYRLLFGLVNRQKLAS